MTDRRGKKASRFIQHHKISGAILVLRRHVEEEKARLSSQADPQSTDVG